MSGKDNPTCLQNQNRNGTYKFGVPAPKFTPPAPAVY